MVWLGLSNVQVAALQTDLAHCSTASVGGHKFFMPLLLLGTVSQLKLETGYEKWLIQK